MSDISGTNVHNVNVNMKTNFSGNVCPKCYDSQFVSSFSGWHVFFAICFFPLGLLSFFFPVKTCVKCSTRYGVGDFFGRAGVGCLGMIVIFFVLIAIMNEIK